MARSAKTVMTKTAAGKSDSKNFYITTTLPYVNSDPHIGFAMELARADIIVRYKKLAGFDVFFNTGTDEHGLKIYRKALEQGKDPQKYVDEYAEKFKALIGALGVSPEVNFIRTTDKHHIRSAQEFWRRCAASGDIYKKNYQVKYCVGCELEKTESELVDGKCPLHPTLSLEIISEENYFFRFSKYQKPLLEFYEKHPDFVVPDSRYNEIKKFVERGLEDFSISRLKSKMPWGVPVPDDDGQVMYVWFDALVNYISAVGWPHDMAKFEKWWVESGGVVQYAGKDNLRQQSAMWQAMLMSAGLPNSARIIINGFITSGGQKMSKSLGNVVSPFDVVKEYGAEALRYFLAREISSFEDGDFTAEKFKESYNANLANGLGNLASRVMKMTEKYFEKPVAIPSDTISNEWRRLIDSYDIQKACDFVWAEISVCDRKIQETEPFKLAKTDLAAARKILEELVTRLYAIGEMLDPIMPETSAAIKKAVKENKMFDRPLFPRKD